MLMTGLRVAGGVAAAGTAAVLLGTGYYKFISKPTSLDPACKDRATSTCRCGKTVLTFRNPRPIFHVQCCCFSCRQRHQWSRANGCPLGEYSQPHCAVYLHNAVTQLIGEVQPIALRDGGAITSLISTCCCTEMAAVHEVAYFGNVAVIPHRNLDSVTQHRAGVAQARVQTGEWDAAKVGPKGGVTSEDLPPYKGSGSEFKSFTPGNFYSSGLLGAFLEKPWREAGDRTVEEIIAETGPAQVLGILEYAPVSQDDPRPLMRLKKEE